MRIARGCLLAGLVAASAFGAEAQQAKGDLIWGANGHPLVSYPGTTIEQQLDYLVDLGMTSYRVDIGGAHMAPRLANLIAAAKARGIAILPVIVPALDLDKHQPQELYAKAHELAVALVSQFKDDIRVWELGNELENYAIIQPCEMRDDGVQYNCGWGPAGGVGPLEYYGPRWAKVSAVLKGLSDGTTAVDPTIRKAMGTAGWGHTGALARMQQDGIRWDISVWHMYGEDPESAFKVLASFNRPIWVTEFNHAQGGAAGEREQARGLAFAVTRLRQLRSAYNVEAAHVYELMDETYWAPNFEAMMGLVRLDRNGKGGWQPGALKPAYVQVKQLIARSDGPAPGSGDCHLNGYNRLNSPSSMQLSYVYCLALQRPPDGAGFRDWIETLKGGGHASQVLLAHLTSGEFAARHGVGGLSNADFVALMYRTLLGREADGGGRSTYASALDTGAMTRSQVAASIVGSAEFSTTHPMLGW
jgi:Domain of unknown function (DUF4214)